MLQQLDGPKWRENLPAPTLNVTPPQMIAAPPKKEMIEPAPAASAQAPPTKPLPPQSSQSTEEFMEEEFEKYKDQGREFVKKVN